MLISIRIPDELLKQAKQAAASNNEASLSAFVRRAIEREVSVTSSARVYKAAYELFEAAIAAEQRGDIKEAARLREWALRIQDCAD
jgi:metal-responsive CopG/Arc/MetJ family transcriptional regulator